MTVQAVGDIVRRLPAEVVTVGVFRNEQPERVVEIANSIGLAAVQLHGNETLAQVAYVAERVRTVIRAVPAESLHVQTLDEAGLDYLHLDGANPGSGEVHGWGVLAQRPLRTPVIAAGGLTPESVAGVVLNLPVWGVDVSTGVESSPGVKDPVRVSQFITRAREAFNQRDGDVDERPFDWSRS